jgi:hypothetical protein
VRWSVCWLSGQVILRLTGQEADWLTDRLIGQLTCWLVNYLYVGCMAIWSVSLLAEEFIG